MKKLDQTSELEVRALQSILELGADNANALGEPELAYAISKAVEVAQALRIRVYH